MSGHKMNILHRYYYYYYSNLSIDKKCMTIQEY